MSVEPNEIKKHPIFPNLNSLVSSILFHPIKIAMAKLQQDKIVRNSTKYC